MHRTIRSAIAVAAIAAAQPAAAHVVFAEPQAIAGSYYAGFLRVSHGCAGSPTVSLRVEIPDSVVSAKPQPKPGWTLKVEKAPLPAPIKGEGGAEIRERVTAITWTGNLSPDEFDQFGIMMKLGSAPGALYFPATQSCAKGANNWTAIPAAGQQWRDLETPAPVLHLTAPKAAAAHQH